jgi:hypothetical protein
MSRSSASSGPRARRRTICRGWRGAARRTPAHFTALKSEALLRLLVAGFMRRLFELHLNLVDEVSASSTGPGSSSVRIGGHGAASCR